MSRTLALTDSVRGVGQAVLDRGQDRRLDRRLDRRGARATICLCFLQFHERRDPASGGAADRAVQGLTGL